MVAGDNNNYRDEKRAKIRFNAIPRISLTSSPSFGTSQIRTFSAHSAGDDVPPKTLREKLADQRERGTEAAKHGATSFKDMVSRYGPVFVGTYFGVYVTTLGSLWALVESGLVDPAYVISWIAEAEDKKTTAEFIADFLGHYTLTTRFVPIVESNPSMANLAVAWIAVKFTEPIRFGLTVAIVPRLARKLGFSQPKESTGDSEKAKSEVKEESDLQSQTKN